MKYIISIFAVIALNGCFYAKVKLSAGEKKIAGGFKNLKTVVLHSASGLTDTVDYIARGAYKNGFESNWDVWLDAHTAPVDPDYWPMRTLYFSTTMSSRGRKGRSHLNLFSNIRLTMTNSENGLMLCSDDFEEEFYLNEQAGDTVVFSKRKYKKCPDADCMAKIAWSFRTGIVEIVQENGTVWRPEP